MAFCQSTIAVPRRPLYQQQEHTVPAPEPVVEQRPPAESQEWVLFPVRSRSSIQTYTASTARTPKTSGLSRLSEFGSLGTVARSEEDTHIRQSLEEGAVDEDEELDSLDEGLHAFQESSLYPEGRGCDQSESIFPRHDGLGMFPASNLPVQGQIWHYEQYNHGKRPVSGHHRRRSSVQRRLDAVEQNDEATIERERTDRIEKWRHEQSSILLNEVEKQTRRRLGGVNRSRNTAIHLGEAKNQSESEDEPRTKYIGREESATTPNSALMEQESLWQFVTRRVIRDFIGIDDAILEIIFGEALPGETIRPSPRLSSSRMTEDLALVPRADVGWEKLLLDRISRELGILVQHLSDHPGAFSTPSITPPLEYAGTPILPQSATTSPLLSPNQEQPLRKTLPTTPHFTPTLQQQQQQRPSTSSTSASDSHHAALWGIEEEAQPSPAVQPQTDLEYWERPPTLSTVFRLLHRRFVSSRPSAHPKPPNIAATNTADSLRRAAIIRQHHPLVSRAHANTRSRRAMYSSYSFSYGEKRRGDSSCASVSAKRRRSGSSRNYWDLAGSVGKSDSLGGGGFGMGGWGEV